MFGIGYYGKIQTPLRQTHELHSQMQTTGLPQKNPHLGHIGWF